MVDFDPSTPQLKAAKNWIDAYLSLDIKNVDPLISKNYEYQAFPEAANLPREAKERHLKRYGDMLAVASKWQTLYHEVIEAPGKVIFHATAVMTTVFGASFSYESVLIITLVEEGGELKVLHRKDFADPQERNALITGALEAAAQRAAA